MGLVMNVPFGEKIFSKPTHNGVVDYYSNQLQLRNKNGKSYQIVLMKYSKDSKKYNEEIVFDETIKDKEAREKFKTHLEMYKEGQ